MLSMAIPIKDFKFLKLTRIGLGISEGGIGEIVSGLGGIFGGVGGIFGGVGGIFAGVGGSVSGIAGIVSGIVSGLGCTVLGLLPGRSALRGGAACKGPDSFTSSWFSNELGSISSTGLIST